MHGFNKLRASRSDYVQVVHYYWDTQSVNQRKAILIELAEHGHPSAAADPFETLVHVLINVLQKSPETYWQGEVSQSVHTYRGGLPGLGGRS